MRAFLGQIGGRQIDGDALERQRQADGGQRCPHPLAAFGHRLVGKADNVELPATGIADMHLHIDFPGFDALKGDGIDVRDSHAFVLSHGRTENRFAPTALRTFPGRCSSPTGGETNENSENWRVAPYTRDGW